MHRLRKSGNCDKSWRTKTCCNWPTSSADSSAGPSQGLKSRWGALSTVVGIICPPGWDRVNCLAQNWEGGPAPPLATALFGKCDRLPFRRNTGIKTSTFTQLIKSMLIWFISCYLQSLTIAIVFELIYYTNGHPRQLFWQFQWITEIIFQLEIFTIHQHAI
jgi:hypothetical protein